MSLAFGKEFLAIPGPSVMPDRVLAAMQRPAPNIYEGELVEMTYDILADLQRVAVTEEALPAIYIANGHGAWEAAIANLFNRGDRVLVLNAGTFAAGWAEMAQRAGVSVEVMEHPKSGVVSAERLEARLREDIKHSIKAVMVVQVDTASGGRNDLPALRHAIDAAGHPALFCVEAIASLGSEPLFMDAWKIDLLVAASQKGLMTPPGLGFVWAGPKARNRPRTDLATSYWDWTPRFDPDLFYKLFCGTPPTHHLFALREALTMLLEEEGLEQAWTRHEVLANATRACVSQWCEGNEMQFNIKHSKDRSNVVTTIQASGFDTNLMRQELTDMTGTVLGIGIGFTPGTVFRIGHMGHLNPPMLLGALASAEAGFKALNIRFESGINAATGVISREMTKRKASAA